MRGRTLTEGPVLSGLLTFCGPVLLALILQALYGAVDLWAVGRFGTTADISAVSTGSQTMQMVIGGITGLSMGVTVLLGRAMGRGDDDGAARAVGASLWVFGLLGAALSLVMVLAAGPIARGMNAPAEALDQTADYIRICGGGSLCIAAYNLLSAIFRGMGDARSPLVFVAIACVVNVAGDLALIRGLGLGAAGAAMATVAAQGVSVVLSLALIRRRGLPFVIRRTYLRPDGRTAGSILLLGAPIALQDVCNEASYLILIGLVNALGVTASAGVGIAEKLVLFILLIPVAYMQSISAFTAQNLGAGQPDRAKKALWTGMATAVLLGGLAAWAAFFHGEALSMLFLHGKGGGQGAVAAASWEFLRATSVECLLLSAAYCLTGYFNGLGRTRFVMVQGLCSIFLVKIPYAWWASRQAEPELFQIGLSTVWAALFSLVVCLIYYRWKGRKLS